MRPVLAFIIIAITLVGCANRESARNLARYTLQMVVQYEKEVDRKISAEKRFYRDQLEIIRTSLGGTPVVRSQNNRATRKAREKKGARGSKKSGNDQIEAIKKTWLYGHIRTTAENDARRTAGEILSRHPGQGIALVIDYLDRGIKGNSEAIAQMRARQRQLAQQLAKSLQPLEKQKKKLAALRKGLTKLAAKPSTSDQFRQVEALAKVVISEMTKNE